MTRRVLFVTYYFPPSGGSGVQRPLKFIKYLGEFGWRPTVLTVGEDYATYPSIDLDMARDIPEDVEISRSKAWDPYALYTRLSGTAKLGSAGVGFIQDREPDWKERLSRRIRANLFIPDARLGWVPFAISRARALVDQYSFDAIVTSGPPHSTHLVGKYVSRKFRIPWVADFRDPWTDISYYDLMPRSRLSRAIDEALERGVLRSAHRVVSVSPSLRELLSTKTKTPIVSIANGFDPEDFVDLKPRVHEGFSIVHAGHLSAAQNPIGLWRAIRQATLPGGVIDLHVNLVGHTDVEIKNSIDESDIGLHVRCTPYVPHKDVIEIISGADLLLVSIPRTQHSNLIVTGKIYEYMASGRPVIGIGPEESDAARLLAETGAGMMFHWDDVAGIESYVKSHYDAWKRKAPLTGAERKNVELYNRRELTGELATLLSETASSRKT